MNWRREGGGERRGWSERGEGERGRGKEGVQRRERGIRERHVCTSGSKMYIRVFSIIAKRSGLSYRQGQDNSTNTHLLVIT